jgi:Cu-Zn family superoxide dismutase
MMDLNKVLVGALGVAVAGALGVSGVAVAHRGTSMTGRTATQMLAAASTVGSAGGSPSHARAVLRDVKGNRVAQVDIYALPHGGNRVTVQAWNLTPGFHGIHIHAMGVCDPGGAKPFTSAGGHFNPTGGAEGMQAGAFPVLLAGADGRAAAEFLDGNFNVRDLFGQTGTAIVVHALPDNYANIPDRYTSGGVAGPDMDTKMTGDGGSRVACGVLTKLKG